VCLFWPGLSVSRLPFFVTLPTTARKRDSPEFLALMGSVADKNRESKSFKKSMNL
jgi:hypothetical protein